MQNLEIKKINDEKKASMAAQFAAEATLRRVHAAQKDDDMPPIEAILAPLEAELKLAKQEVCPVFLSDNGVLTSCDQEKNILSPGEEHPVAGKDLNIIFFFRSFFFFAVIIKEQKGSIIVIILILPLITHLNSLQIAKLQDDNKALDRLTKSKEAALLEAERTVQVALAKASMVDDLQNKNQELMKQIEICQVNKILHDILFPKCRSWDVYSFRWHRSMSTACVF